MEKKTEEQLKAIKWLKNEKKIQELRAENNEGLFKKSIPVLIIYAAWFIYLVIKQKG